MILTLLGLSAHCITCIIVFGNVYIGSVYVYDVSGNAFAFEQKITAFDSSSDNAQDAFGYSLSLYDDQLAISSFFDDDISSASGTNSESTSTT